MLWIPSREIWTPPAPRIERPKRKRPPFPGADELEDAYAMPAGCVNVMGGGGPAFPCPVYDTYTAANGTNLTAHLTDTGQGPYVTPSGVWSISSNEVIYSGGTAFDDTIGLDVGNANVSVTGTVGTITGTGASNAGLAVRRSDASNFIYMRYSFDTNTIDLYKFFLPSLTLLGQVADTRPISGDTFTLSVDSSNAINCYHNGVLKLGPITNSYNSTVTKVALAYSSGNPFNWTTLCVKFL